jgi:predicted RNase H-like HicB family nuclease
MQIGNKNYEILVRRQGEDGYSAFCPQLELIVRGTAHEQVENKMKQLIEEHVAKEEAASGGSAESKK